MMRQVGDKKRAIIIWMVLGSLILAVPGVFAQEKEGEGAKYVSIDFNDVDIRVFIKFMSELTNENFIIDDRVKGNVNILSPDKITIEEAYKVFESVLEVHGFTPVKAGKITKIIPMPLARSKSVETRLDPTSGLGDDKIVTQLIPLRYADANELKALYAPLISQGSVILSYSPTNTLIITDVFSNIQRLVKITKAIDLEDVGRQLSIIPIEHADAGAIVKTLTMLFKESKAPKGPRATPDVVSEFVADERTNILIVLANEFNTAKVKRLVEVLDQKVPKGDAKIRVYYLENAKAEDMATVLQSLSGQKAAKEEGKKEEPVVSDKVKITADKSTNSLIIMADKDEYMVLETIIQKLDIARPMVYIEALIMEVRDTDEFTLGVEWIAGTSAGTIDGRDAGAYGGFTSEGGVKALPTVDSAGVVSIPGGFAMGVMTGPIQIGNIFFPSIGAAIKALEKNENVHIISTPQIMTIDNEEAMISVGENVPYQTSIGTGTAGVQDYQNFEYKDVGVTLKITPQISQERFVRLNIFQEVQKLSSEATSLTPTTLKRSAQTTVVVKDAATVVIGGLIGEDLSSRDSQVPCLGDIPVMGNLFKSTSRGGVRSNLYIFVTPHIIQNPTEADVIYQKKREEIDRIKQETIKLYKEDDKTPEVLKE